MRTNWSWLGITQKLGDRSANQKKNEIKYVIDNPECCFRQDKTKAPDTSLRYQGTIRNPKTYVVLRIVLRIVLRTGHYSIVQVRY
jgi:hypothetical protein